MKKQIAVVGAGKWGKNHIHTLEKLGFLGGVIDQDKKLLERFSNKYRNLETYQNLNESFENENLVGFTVATPAHTHHKIAEQIIKAGKHVLVEKPLCLNIKDANNLVNLAMKHNVNLMVGHVLLFHSAIQKIKQLIKNGVIGKLQYIYSNRLNLGQIRTEENVFWSLAPMTFLFFQYLTESYPISINAVGSIFLQKGIHDSTVTHLKYPNGVEGHVFVSWLHPFKEHRLVVIGSEAMILFEDSAEGKPLKLFSKKFDLYPNKLEKIDGPMKLIDYKRNMPLTEELEYFSNHLNNKKPKIANAEHAIEVMQILIEASNKLEQYEKK